MMVSMAQKLKMAKTCRKQLFQHIKVVLCKNGVEKHLIYAFSPGRNYILCSYWAAVPELLYWAMKKHGHEIDLE